MSRLHKVLRNFPKRKGDTYESLLEIVEKRRATQPLSDKQAQRLKRELSVVKATDTGGVFLFFYRLVQENSASGLICHGLMHCSFLCYFLGLTKVDPFWYDLPFERFYSVNRQNLPLLALVVKKGEKGRVLARLQAEYGKDCIARLQDSKDEYVLSKKRLSRLTTIKTVFHEEGWEENISMLSRRDVFGLSLYTFTIQEGEVEEHTFTTDSELLSVADGFYIGHYFDEISRYEGIDEVEAIFASTGGKYVFQEQFYELCLKVLRLNEEVAEKFRKGLAKRQEKAVENIRATFVYRLGEAGERLMDYVRRYHIYTVCKAYVIGLTFIHFD